MEITATTILALIATVLGVVVGYFAGVGSYAAAGGTAAALAACFGGLLYALIKENAHRSVRVADDSDVENPKSGVSEDAKHKEKPRKQSVQKEPRASAIKQAAKAEVKQLKDAAHKVGLSFEREAMEWLAIAEETSRVLEVAANRMVGSVKDRPALTVRTRSTRSNSLTRIMSTPVSKSGSPIIDEVSALPNFGKPKTPGSRSEFNKRRSRQMSKILIDRALPIGQVMTPRERRDSEAKSPRSKTVLLRSNTQKAVTGMFKRPLPETRDSTSGLRPNIQGVVMSETTKLKSQHWAEIMNDYDAALFVVSLLDYVDPSKLKLAVKLFAKVYASQRMAHMPVILVLNKVDDFERSMEHVPISDYYHFYNAGKSCFEGVDFIKQMFETAVIKFPTREFVYVVGSVSSDVSFQSIIKQIVGVGTQGGISGDMNFLVLGTSGSGKATFCEQLTKHYSSLAGFKADVDAQEKEFKNIQIVEGSLGGRKQWAELLGSVRCTVFIVSLDTIKPKDLDQSVALFRRVFYSPKLAVVPIILVLNKSDEFDTNVASSFKAGEYEPRPQETSPEGIIDYVRQRFELSVITTNVGDEGHVVRETFHVKVGNPNDNSFIVELGTLIQSSKVIGAAGNTALHESQQPRTKTLILGRTGCGKKKISELLTNFDKRIESESMQEENVKESFEVVSVTEGALGKRAAWDLLVAHAKTSVFLVSMLEYRNPRKLEKTIDLFHRVFHSPKLAHIPTIIVFTQPDICEEELKQKSLKSVYNDYSGPENYEGLLSFLEAKFRKACKTKPSFKTLTVVSCNLKDDESFRLLLRNNLHKVLSGYFKQLELRKVLVLGAKDSGKATFSSQLKKHTDGIVTDVATEQMQDQMFDVNEVKEDSMAARRIWEHVIHGATSVVFLCPLTLYTDPTQLKRAVMLFDKICKSPRLKDKHLVLLLTKLDTIDSCIDENSISGFWSSYTGPENVEGLSKFFVDMFSKAAFDKDGAQRSFVTSRGSLVEPEMFTSMIQQTLEVLIRKHRFEEQILKTIVLGPKQSGKSTFSRMLRTYYTNYEPECSSDLLAEVALNTDVVYSNKTATRDAWSDMIKNSHSAVFIVSLTDYVNPAGMSESVKLFARVFHSKKLQKLPLILILSEVTNFNDSIQSNPLNFFYSNLPKSSRLSLQDSVTFIERMFQRECRMRSSSRIFRCECGDLQDMESFKNIIESSVELQKQSSSTSRGNNAPHGDRVGVLVLGSDERGKKIFSDQIQYIYKQQAQTSSMQQQYSMVEPHQITDGEIASRNVWMSTLQEVQLAVFITPLTSYVHLSDLEHSLELFHKVSSSSKLAHVSLVLIFSELREFSRMIEKIPMKSLFDGFDGAGDLESSIGFMKMLFQPENREIVCITGDVDDKKDGMRLMNETFAVQPPPQQQNSQKELEDASGAQINAQEEQKNHGGKAEAGGEAGSAGTGQNQQQQDFRKALILGPEHKAKSLFNSLLKSKIKETQSATEEQQNDIVDEFGKDDSADAAYRRQWADMIAGVGNIVFIADCRHYSCPAKFYKSLKWFRRVCRSRKLLQARVVLVLTNLDKMRAQLEAFPMQNYLPEFRVSNDVDAAVNFIRVTYEMHALEGIDRSMTVAQGAFDEEGAIRGLCNLMKSKSKHLSLEFNKLLILGSEKPSVLDYFSSTISRVSDFEVVGLKPESVDAVIELDAAEADVTMKQSKQKWVELIHGLDVVFFVSPLTSYTQEDELKKALAMFASIFRSKKLDGIPIILVLSKEDIFKEFFTPALLAKVCPEFTPSAASMSDQDIKKDEEADTGELLKADLDHAKRCIVEMFRKKACEQKTHRDFECIVGTAISESSFHEMLRMSETLVSLSKERHSKVKTLILGSEGSGREGFSSKMCKHFSKMSISSGSDEDQQTLVKIDEVDQDKHANRSHWNEIVSNVSAIVFIASSVDYSDPERMVHSMKLFSRVVNSEKLKDLKMTLIMSKTDMVPSHLVKDPLIRYMSDYTGSGNADQSGNAAVEFIASKYREIAKTARKVAFAKCNLTNAEEVRNVIATTIGDVNQREGGSNRVLVLGGKGAGKSTFSEQLKENGNFTTEDADSRVQDEMLGVLEVKKGALADRNVWSNMLNASRALLFVSSLDALEGDASKLEETIRLFRKTFTSSKLEGKRVVLLLISSSSSSGVSSSNSDESTSNGEKKETATVHEQQDPEQEKNQASISASAKSISARFEEAVADVKRPFTWLSGRLDDDSFILKVRQVDGGGGSKEASAKGKLIILGPSEKEKSELARRIKQESKEAEAAPIASQAEQEAIEGQEINEGNVSSRKSWAELIAGTHVGVFIVSLESCLESSLCKKAIRMFDKMCRSPKLESVRLCLVLSKQDQFEESVRASEQGMIGFYPDEYNGDGHSIPEALQFIQRKFSLCGGGLRRFQTTCGNIDDDESFKRMCAETLDVASEDLRAGSQHVNATSTSEPLKVLILGPKGGGKTDFSEQLSKHKSQYKSSDAIDNEDLKHAGLLLQEIEEGTTASKDAWNEKIKHTDAVLFLISLTEYTNPDRFRQSLKLFARVYHSPKLANVPVILVMNKDDAFSSRIETVPLSAIFEDFEGPDDYENSLSYIRGRFAAVANQKGESRDFRALTSCLLYSWSFKNLVYQAVEEPLLRQNYAVDFSSMNLLVLGNQGVGKSTFSRLMYSHFMAGSDNTTSASVSETKMMFEAFNITEGKKETREHWEDLLTRVKDVLFVVSIAQVFDDMHLEHSLTLFRKVYSSTKLEHVHLDVVLNNITEFEGKLASLKQGIGADLAKRLGLSEKPRANQVIPAIEKAFRDDVQSIHRKVSEFAFHQCNLTDEKSLKEIIAKSAAVGVPTESATGVGGNSAEGGSSSSNRITLVLGNDDDGKAVLSARLKSMGTATKVSDLSSSSGYND